MMNQSTSFAQVATNLLNVLQGYTKGIRFLLVMFLTLIVTTNAWGATYTKITTLSDLTTGDYVIVGYQKASSYGRLISGTLNNKRLAYTSHYTSAPSSYTTTEATEIWHLEVTGTGDTRNVTIYNDDKKQYLNPGFAWSNSSTSWTVSYNNGFSFKSGTDYLGVNKSSNYWRSYASSTLTSVYGIILLKAAASCTTPPTVSSASNSNITSTTATVSCSSGITSLGSAGCSITSYGFVYGTSSNPTISNTKVQVGTTYATTGTAFSKELTGLTANTTYYVRPYATNGNGTAYGTQTSFKTLELPKYTVTLVPGSGSVPSTTLTETSAGAGVELPEPTLDCGEWSFAGWKTSSAVTEETTTKPTLIPAGAYNPASNITLYAVYQRTEETEGVETTTITTDKLTRSTTGIANGAGYGAWSGKTANSSAVYAGQSAGGNNAIQLRTTNSNSGIITTASGGKVAKITVVWDSNTADDRTLDIYGKNSAYSAATDLYNTSTQGTILGSIVNGTSTELTISGDYEYIGLRSNSNAMYLTSISIDWATSTGGGTSSTTYYHSTPECTTETSVCLVHKYGRARYGLVPDGNGVLTVW